MLTFSSASKQKKIGVPNLITDQLVFSVFGLNAEIYSINLIIQSNYRKIRTRKKSLFGDFSFGECLNEYIFQFMVLDYWQWLIYRVYIAVVLSVSVKEACLDKYPKLVLWSSGNNTQFVQRALSSIPEMAKMLKLRDHNEILSKPNPCHSFSICHWIPNNWT